VSERDDDFNTTHDSRPVPDPTSATTTQLIRVAKSERDYTDGQIAVLQERLRGIDRATEVLDESVNRMPTALQEAIQHLRELDEEKFRSVSLQFAERDLRSERESRDNKVAVDAAFAAQKEAAAQAEISNAKAIDKSEAATSETIAKLNELFESNSRALTDKIDDVKLRLTQIESLAIGGRQAVSDRQSGITSSSAMWGVIIALLTLVAIIAVSTHGFTK
jgi:hypothetical protein